MYRKPLKVHPVTAHRIHAGRRVLEDLGRHHARLPCPSNPQRTEVRPGVVLSVGQGLRTSRVGEEFMGITVGQGSETAPQVALDGGYSSFDILFIVVEVR